MVSVNRRASGGEAAGPAGRVAASRGCGVVSGYPADSYFNVPLTVSFPPTPTPAAHPLFPQRRRPSAKLAAFDSPSFDPTDGVPPCPVWRLCSVVSLGAQVAKPRYAWTQTIGRRISRPLKSTAAALSSPRPLLSGSIHWDLAEPALCERVGKASVPAFISTLGPVKSKSSLGHWGGHG